MSSSPKSPLRPIPPPLQLHSHHSHSHDHTHLHAAEPDQDLTSTKRISVILAICIVTLVVFVVVEALAGVLTNSLALLSDAGHNLTDALALLSSWGAMRLARSAPNFSQTYGYGRAGILAAALNGLALTAIALYVFYESIQRLLSPPEVQAGPVILIASAGLAINLLLAGLLHRGSQHDLNTRSAFLHLLLDAAASVGVIVAGLAEWLWHWHTADPVISAGIAYLILHSGWRITAEAGRILLEAVPDSVDMLMLVRDLLRQPGVIDIHDLHVWTIASGRVALSCHLVMAENCTLSQTGQTLKGLRTLLSTRYRVGHTTIQIECDCCEFDEMSCAVPPEHQF